MSIRTTPFRSGVLPAVTKPAKMYRKLHPFEEVKVSYPWC